ncbi:MAG: hypothetical protein M3R24_07955 [Chloroflexota bacterium]|nr:hypothetical protein [Chloroflexota bacterium]
MKSQLTDDFITYFRALPEEVWRQARKNYQLWKQNPYHPSLHFKRVHAHEPLYSVRIGLGWRALGLFEDDVITWFWIGSHAEYDRLIQ